MLKGTLDVAEKNSLFISRARPTALDWLSPQVSVSCPLPLALDITSFVRSRRLSFSRSLVLLLSCGCSLLSNCTAEKKTGRKTSKKFFEERRRGIVLISWCYE